MSTRKITITALDIVSVGKLQGAVLAAFALVVGVIAAVFVLVTGVSEGVPVQGGVGAIAILILFPLLYGGGGFIAGLIGAVIYNLAARTLGGIRLTFRYEEEPEI